MKNLDRLLPLLAAALLASAGCATVLAGPTACPAHFANGASPVIVNPRLAQRSRELCFTAFAVMHSGLTRTPLWSAQHLTRASVLSARRQTRINIFHPDERLPVGERAELRDYARSGLDRGHMAPSGDMPDAVAQAESFSLANMVPQDPELNRHLWEGIESAVRDLAMRRGELFVVTGPLFEGADLAVLKGRVFVPTSLYKLVYDPRTREAAAYIVVNQPTTQFRAVNVSELERRAGISFLPNEAKERRLDLPPPRVRGKTRSRSDLMLGL